MPSRINRTLKHVSPWNPANFYALNASGSPQRYVGGFRSALETTALGYYNYLKMLAAGVASCNYKAAKRTCFQQNRTPLSCGDQSSFEQSFNETEKGDRACDPLLGGNSTE